MYKFIQLSFKKLDGCWHRSGFLVIEESANKAHQGLSIQSKRDPADPIFKKTQLCICPNQSVRRANRLWKNKSSNVWINLALPRSHPPFFCWLSFSSLFLRTYRSMNPLASLSKKQFYCWWTYDIFLGLIIIDLEFRGCFFLVALLWIAPLF